MIRRTEHSHSKRFSIVSRKLAQDKRLSFQARGLLHYVLSKPDGWEAKDRDLMREGGIKQHAYTSILNELKEFGYAQRVRRRGPGGKFTFSLEIFEEPGLTGEEPLPDYPLVAHPVVDNQVVASIDSTGARARPSSRLTELRESVHSQPLPRVADSDDSHDDRAPRYSIEELQNPKLLIEACGIDMVMTEMFRDLPFPEFYRKWWLNRMGKGGIGRRTGAKATLRQYAANLEAFFLLANEYRQNPRGNVGKDEYRGPIGQPKETPEQKQKRESCTRCNGTGTEITKQGARPCNHEPVS